MKRMLQFELIVCPPFQGGAGDGCVTFCNVSQNNQMKVIPLNPLSKGEFSSNQLED